MGAAQDNTKPFFVLPIQQTRTVGITLLVRIFQAEEPALSGAVVKWIVKMMNEGVPLLYHIPSQNVLLAFRSIACLSRSHESVVTNTLTSEVGLIKSNGATVKGDIYNEMHCTF